MWAITFPWFADTINASLVFFHAPFTFMMVSLLHGDWPNADTIKRDMPAMQNSFCMITSVYRLSHFV
jgi:hypothetical protein